MGVSYRLLKTYGESIELERRESVVTERSDSNLITRKRTVVRERFAHPSAVPSTGREAEEEESIVGKVPVDLNLIDCNRGSNLIYAVEGASNQLKRLADEIDNEISKLKQEHDSIMYKELGQKGKKNAGVQMRSSPKNVAGTKSTAGGTKQRGGGRSDNGNAGENVEFCIDKYSSKHKFVCTSPRYARDEQTSCRPRMRTIGLQKDTQRSCCSSPTPRCTASAPVNTVDQPYYCFEYGCGDGRNAISTAGNAQTQWQSPVTGCHRICERYNSMGNYNGMICNTYNEVASLPCANYNYSRNEYYCPTDNQQRVLLPEVPAAPLKQNYHSSPGRGYCTCGTCCTCTQYTQYGRRVSDLNTEDFAYRPNSFDHSPRQDDPDKEKKKLASRQKEREKQKERQKEREKEKQRQRELEEEKAKRDRSVDKQTKRRSSELERELRDKLSKMNSAQLQKLLLCIQRQEGSSDSDASLKEYKVRSKEKFVKITLQKKKQKKKVFSATSDVDSDDRRQYSKETVRALKQMRISSYGPGKSEADKSATKGRDKKDKEEKRKGRRKTEEKPTYSDNKEPTDLDYADVSSKKKSEGKKRPATRAKDLAESLSPTQIEITELLQRDKLDDDKEAFSEGRKADAGYTTRREPSVVSRSYSDVEVYKRRPAAHARRPKDVGKEPSIDKRKHRPSTDASIVKLKPHDVRQPEKIGKVKDDSSNRTEPPHHSRPTQVDKPRPQSQRGKIEEPSTSDAYGLKPTEYESHQKMISSDSRAGYRPHRSEESAQYKDRSSYKDEGWCYCENNPKPGRKVQYKKITDSRRTDGIDPHKHDDDGWCYCEHNPKPGKTREGRDGSPTHSDRPYPREDREDRHYPKEVREDVSKSHDGRSKERSPRYDDRRYPKDDSETPSRYNEWKPESSGHQSDEKPKKGRDREAEYDQTQQTDRIHDRTDVQSDKPDIPLETTPIIADPTFQPESMPVRPIKAKDKFDQRSYEKVSAHRLPKVVEETETSELSTSLPTAESTRFDVHEEKKVDKVKVDVAKADHVRLPDAVPESSSELKLIKKSDDTTVTTSSIEHYVPARSAALLLGSGGSPTSDSERARKPKDSSPSVVIKEEPTQPGLSPIKSELSPGKPDKLTEKTSAKEERYLPLTLKELFDVVCASREALTTQEESIDDPESVTTTATKRYVPLPQKQVLDAISETPKTSRQTSPTRQAKLKLDYSHKRPQYVRPPCHCLEKQFPLKCCQCCSGLRQQHNHNANGTDTDEMQEIQLVEPIDWNELQCCMPHEQFMPHLKYVEAVCRESKLYKDDGNMLYNICIGREEYFNGDDLDEKKQEAGDEDLNDGKFQLKKGTTISRNCFPLQKDDKKITRLTAKDLQIPEYTGCPCMYQTYLNLVSLYTGNKF